MITVHHLSHSRSQRILWLLEELGLEYEIKRYERDPETQLAPQALRDVHPLGKSPVISDDDLVVAESGAIVEYLIQRYGDKKMQLKAGSAQWRDYQYWMHYAEGSLMPFMVMNLIFEKLKVAPMPFFIRPVAKGIADKVISAYIGPGTKNNLAFVEDYLATHSFFAGDDLTGADIQMLFPLEALVARGAATAHPNITAYVQRMHQRSAYQKVLAVGGDYDFA